MTDQEINIAIAEACGRKKVPFTGQDGENHGEMFQEYRWILYDHNGGIVSTGLPDYCHDLNAMHEAEKTLIGRPLGPLASAHFLYVERLLRLIECDPGVVGDEWKLIHATSQQRAEAFLRTMGKWKGA